jgi:hypothetical protein
MCVPIILRPVLLLLLLCAAASSYVDCCCCCRIDHKAGTQIAIKVIDLEEM